MKYAERARRILANHPGRHKLVAFGVANGKVVSFGVNDYGKTHPHQKLCAIKVGHPERQYLHAEIAAIVKAKQQLDELHVFRINNKGNFLNAAPCEICRTAITLAGIRKVIHT